MAEPTNQHRTLAPGPGPLPSPKHELAMTNSPAQERRQSSDHGKKRASMACLACKKSKRKCSGAYRCDNCIAYDRECVFDETKDQRRRVTAKHTAEELVYYQNYLDRIFKVVKAENEFFGQMLFDSIRKGSSREDVWYTIEAALPLIDGNLPYTITSEGPFRPQVMDINYLCTEPPYLVPAEPWTTVTRDSSLVSHLVSLYFTCDYPSHVFLDRDVFLRHMNVGDTGSELCSPFLVNALLANACHFSEYSDVFKQGDAFLEEAERLDLEMPQQPTLSYLQGTLMLYEKYSLSGEKGLGYTMLHRAICVGQSLGLIDSSGTNPTFGQVSKDMETSQRMTAWGLFHIDTVVHANFLRPSPIYQVMIARPKSPTTEGLWNQYPPDSTEPDSAYFDEYFAKSCDLSEIARNMSQSLFARDDAGSLTKDWQDEKAALRTRLSEWSTGMQEHVRVDNLPPSYVLIMVMRYHTLLINLMLYNADIEAVKDVSKAMITPESPTGDIEGMQAYETVQSAAKSIACLTRMHQRTYDLLHAHHFALYAIYLALFVFLDLNREFDITNDDFLYLACTFGNIASRSQVGRNLFHLFRQAVRDKHQGYRIRETDRVTDVVKDLFDENYTEPTPFDGYAKGIENLEDNERYHTLAGYHPLCKKLNNYETLSLGRYETALERDSDHG
ncbi:C6 transcription factor [Aspergillus heterothallicus]